MIIEIYYSFWSNLRIHSSGQEMPHLIVQYDSSRGAPTLAECMRCEGL